MRVGFAIQNGTVAAIVERAGFRPLDLSEAELSRFFGGNPKLAGVIETGPKYERIGKILMSLCDPNLQHLGDSVTFLSLLENLLKQAFEAGQTYERRQPKRRRTPKKRSS